MRKNGESSNPVTYLLLLVIAAAGFYAFHVAPIYMDNLAAKDAIGEAWATYFIRGQKFSLDQLLFRMNNRSPDTSHIEVDEDGVEKKVPGFGIKPEQVIYEWDEKARFLTVKVEYERIVDFKPLKKRKIFKLVAEKSGKFDP